MSSIAAIDRAEATRERTREVLRGRARAATPARLFLGGPGTSYATADLLSLRAEHARAKDALCAEVTSAHPLVREIARSYGLVALETCATSLREYLLRPDLGRRLSPDSAARLARQATPAVDLQVILGDGLSPDALAEHARPIVTGLHELATANDWSFGTPLFVQRARVGVLNDIGDLTGCRVAVLLIGERPGLQTPRSLSAYLAYGPRAGATDAERNLVCNIQPDGLTEVDALRRITALVTTLAARRASGVTVKETFESNNTTGEIR